MDGQLLISQIKQINRDDYDPEVHEELDSMVNQLEELEALKNLSNHFVIQDLLKRYKGEIENINGLLLEKREMTKDERDRLLDKRDIFKDLIETFNPDGRMTEISRYIDDLKS